MLLVWLLALAAGVVNACLLEPQATPRIAGTVSVVGHHHGASQATNPPCAKFCSDTSTSVQTAQPQFDAGLAMLAPPPVRPAPDAAAAVAMELALDGPSLHGSVSIPIAFLRLTL